MLSGEKLLLSSGIVLIISLCLHNTLTLTFALIVFVCLVAYNVGKDMSNKTIRVNKNDPKYLIAVAATVVGSIALIMQIVALFAMAIGEM